MVRHLWLVVLCMLVPTLVLAQPGTGVKSGSIIKKAVNDLVPVLDDPTTLEDRLVRYHRQRGLQMAVLIIDSTNGEPIEDYANRVASAWQGGDAERQDGVLFVLAVNDRRMRLEVGYGLESLLTDARAKRILEGAKPHLRRFDYDEAVDQVVSAVLSLHANGPSPEPRPPRQAQTPFLGDAQPPLPAHRHDPLRAISLWIYGLAMLLGLSSGAALAEVARRNRKREFDAIVEDRERKPAAWWEVPAQVLVVPAGALVAGAIMLAGVSWEQMGAFGLAFLFGWAGSVVLADSPAARNAFFAMMGAVYLVVWFIEPQSDDPWVLVALVHTMVSLVPMGAIGLMMVGNSAESSGGGGTYASSWSSSSASPSWSGSSSWSDSSSSTSSWSSSSSSSSWSSSSSSSSWSSSSSSSSYSGGGGSFGGGGASSSW